MYGRRPPLKPKLTLGGTGGTTQERDREGTNNNKGGDHHQTTRHQQTKGGGSKLTHNGDKAKAKGKGKSRRKRAKLPRRAEEARTRRIQADERREGGAVRFLASNAMRGRR